MPKKSPVTKNEKTTGKHKLVIVESPTKAKKISSFLGSEYVVESSVGHIRDLPRTATEIPAKYKKEPWARLGVNIEKDFEPLYLVSADKKSIVSELKQLLQDADELLLATDGDREGEAIAWHLLEILKPQVPVKRMLFNEITATAIKNSTQNTRELNQNLVNAQETRRILDRLYGYEVSPVLWRKVMPRLSAGRVQSVATRIVVEREQERMKFKSVDYWSLTLKVKPSENNTTANGVENSTNQATEFPIKLHSLDGQRIAEGRDYNNLGQIVSKNKLFVLNEVIANALADELKTATIEVVDITTKPYTRKPAPPFITSTLQQEAAKKFRFSSEKTMRLAQQLYENGYITYMRTDATFLSQTALKAARSEIVNLYGNSYLPKKTRLYDSKVKNAQEAHEAIRPAGNTFIHPQELESDLASDAYKIYELIWQRTLASQMKDAQGTTLTVQLVADSKKYGKCIFYASGRALTFPGYQIAYEVVSEDDREDDKEENKKIPNLTLGQKLLPVSSIAASHKTLPPSRYTEASLVRTLEELGIGRPSTYATILTTIQNRGYVFKKGTALVPAWIAFAVVELLKRYFPTLIDYDFTASMEDDLDDIASGTQQRLKWLQDFYFGNDTNNKGLKELVGGNLAAIDAREINSIYLFDDNQHNKISVRVGRYGPYLERVKDSDSETPELQRVPLREDITPDELNLALAEKLFSNSTEGRLLGTDSATGNQIVVKDGRFGPYVTEVIPTLVDSDNSQVKAVKPRIAALFKTMDSGSVTLEAALSLLALPRVVGIDPDTKLEITAQNGRFGPYLKKGDDSRSLENENDIFSITLDQALEIYKQPKTRSRAKSSESIRELGVDPQTNLPIVIKDGRFGPYVTDGKFNAGLKKTDSIDDMTLERASELLADRRAKPGRGNKKTLKKK